MQTSSIVPTHSKGFASVSPISSCNVGIRFSLSNKLTEKIVFNTVGDRKGDKIISKQALRAITTPNVGFTSHYSTFKYREISRELKTAKQFSSLEGRRKL